MAAEKPTVPAVYPSISAVQKEIEALGITKDKTAKTGGTYKYRGVDAVLDTFAGPLARAQLLIVPSLQEHEKDKVKTNTGEMERSTVKVAFRFVSLIDGSQLAIGTFGGEAADSLDKSLSKAQSVALRTCYLETFTVPLGPATPNGDPMDPEGGEEEGAIDAAQKPTAAAPISKSSRQQSSSTPAEGQVVDDIKPGQKRILDASLARKGLAWSDLVEQFPTINSANFNDVNAWIGKQPSA